MHYSVQVDVDMVTSFEEEFAEALKRADCAAAVEDVMRLIRIDAQQMCL